MLYHVDKVVESKEGTNYFFVILHDYVNSGTDALVNKFCNYIYKIIYILENQLLVEYFKYREEVELELCS